MLPKQHRLVKDQDIRKVFSRGRYFHIAPLSIKTAKSRRARPTRFAFVVANKITKKATERNRVKRRLRAIVAKRLPAIRPGFDAVIMAASKDVVGKGFGELEKVVEGLLRRSRLIQ